VAGGTITKGPDPGVGGTTHGGRIDHHRAVGGQIQSGAFGLQFGGVGHAAGGVEHEVGDPFASVVQEHPQLLASVAVARPRDPGHPAVWTDRQPTIAPRGDQVIDQVRREARQGPRTRGHHTHLHTGGGGEAAQLHADETTADAHHATRQDVEFEEGLAGDREVGTRQLQPPRAGTAVDHDRPRRQRSRPVDGDPVGAGECSEATDEIDPGIRQLLRDIGRAVAHQLALGRHHRAPVEVGVVTRCGAGPERGGLARGAHRPQEGVLGVATAQRAGPARLALVDHRATATGLGGGVRHHPSGRAAADHDQVVGIGLRACRAHPESLAKQRGIHTRL